MKSLYTLLLFVVTFACYAQQWETLTDNENLKITQSTYSYPDETKTHQVHVTLVMRAYNTNSWNKAIKQSDCNNLDKRKDYRYSIIEAFSKDASTSFDSIKINYYADKYQPIEVIRIDSGIDFPTLTNQSIASEVSSILCNDKLIRTQDNSFIQEEYAIVRLRGLKTLIPNDWVKKRFREKGVLESVRTESPDKQSEIRIGVVDIEYDNPENKYQQKEYLLQKLGIDNLDLTMLPVSFLIDGVEASVLDLNQEQTNCEKLITITRNSVYYMIYIRATNESIVKNIVKKLSLDK